MGKKLKNPARRIVFSKGIYAPEAVKLAAYVFSGRAGIKLYFSARGTEAEVSGGGRDCAAAGEFANEVLNQQCRLDLAAKNGKMAGIIIARTLLSASGGTGKTPP